MLWDLTSIIDPSRIVVPKPDSDVFQAAGAVEFTASVIINCPLPPYPVLLKYLDNSVTVWCADGGANSLRSTLGDKLLLEFIQGRAGGTTKRHCLDQVSAISIVGDLDSITDDTLSYFSKYSHRTSGATATVSIVKIDDQNTTDLCKVFQQMTPSLLSTVTPSSGGCILIIGSVSLFPKGRIDQFFSALNTMYSTQMQFGESYRIVSIGEQSIMLVLLPNIKHTIQLPASHIKKHCGLIPVFSCPVESITTDGLVWDMDNHRMEFGKLISTCNIIKKDVVTVRSSDPVLFTLSLNE